MSATRVILDFTIAGAVLGVIVASVIVPPARRWRRSSVRRDHDAAVRRLRPRAPGLDPPPRAVRPGRARRLRRPPPRRAAGAVGLPGRAFGGVADLLRGLDARATPCVLDQHVQ